MHDLDDFLPLVMPYAASAPEPLVKRYLLKAATQFCERTRTWRCNEQITTDGQYPEQIPIPPDGVLYEIAGCIMWDVPLCPISIADLNRERPCWRTDTVATGCARWYISPEWGSIQAIPFTSGTLSVDVIYKPSYGATTLPDFLYDLYAETIADGAAGNVLVTPGQAFANPTLGAALLQRFDGRLGSLANSGHRGQQRALTRTRPSYF